MDAKFVGPHNLARKQAHSSYGNTRESPAPSVSPTTVAALAIRSRTVLVVAVAVTMTMLTMVMITTVRLSNDLGLIGMYHVWQLEGRKMTYDLSHFKRMNI